LLESNLPSRCLNAADAFGRSALHYCAALGKTSALKRLLESNALDVNAKDR